MCHLDRKYSGVDKLLSRRRLFSAQVNLRTQSGMQLNGPLKSKVNILVTTRNVAFCFLLRKYPLQLSFLMHFHQKLT